MSLHRHTCIQFNKALMKKFILSAICTCAAILVSAQELVLYGYAPEQMAENAQIGQGQGGNGFLGGLVCFDPALDPAWKRLEGHQVKGVRCYLRADYKQARQDRSLIMHTVGSADATPTKKICDFLEGWNEIYFDEPLTIGSEPIYLSIRATRYISPIRLLWLGKCSRRMLDQPQQRGLDQLYRPRYTAHTSHPRRRGCRQNRQHGVCTSSNYTSNSSPIKNLRLRSLLQ